MASVRQLEANRANARKSTGPRTETGKAIARLNALTHGLTSQKRVTLAGESEFDYLRLREKLMFEFDPQTSVQTHLVDQLANHLWRLKRVAPFEAGILNLTRGAVSKCFPQTPKSAGEEPQDLLECDLQEHLDPGLKELIIDGLVFILDSEAGTLEKLGRYEARLLSKIKQILRMLEESGCTATPRK